MNTAGFNRTIHVSFLKKNRLNCITPQHILPFSYFPSRFSPTTADRVHVTSLWCRQVDWWLKFYKDRKSTRPKLILYLPSVENMFACILWWMGIKFMSKVFLTRFLFQFQLRYIQFSNKYRSIGVLVGEGLKLVWWCFASARPTFQSTIAVYNFVRWSRITTYFFWIVYFHNE